MILFIKKFYDLYFKEIIENCYTNIDYSYLCSFGKGLFMINDARN